MDKEKLAIITLNLNIELTPRKIISLINYFGSAVNVLNASISDLINMPDGIPEKLAVSTKKIVSPDSSNTKSLFAFKQFKNLAFSSSLKAIPSIFYLSSPDARTVFLSGEMCVGMM